MKIGARTFALTLVVSGLAVGTAQFLKRPAAISLPMSAAVAAPSPNSTVRAPEFPTGLAWFNTQKPLSLKELRGKVVLLDFWTYGCINCLHIIPDLKKLEAKYPNELVVIGVHSAKFDTESKPENVRQAALRYGLEHPVVVDQSMRIWDEYAVRAWPTLTLISPDGRVAGQWAGEGHANTIDAQIAALVKDAKARGTLNTSPLPVALEKAQVENTPLRFPGKVAVNDQFLAVADTSHHRIVISDKAGQPLFTIGDGEAAWRDGDFKTARFRDPQGLFLDGNTLYVADTGNHAIRRVDLTKRTVETIAGVGRQARVWPPSGGAAKTTALSSPWDVLKRGNDLFIAMAGTHQIWKLDLKAQKVEPWAGTAGEARRDGLRQNALFAQPSGLATDGKSLFVADSESSCIRAISFQSGQVTTLAGGDLFEFGDRDGSGDQVRFRHPLGVAWHDGALYIADTYNGNIKKLNPQNREVSTVFFGSLDEPGGIAFDGSQLLIADTGNHTIKKLDLSARKTTVVALNGLNAPQRVQKPVNVAAKPTVPTVPTNAAQAVTLAPGKARLVLDLKFPTGFKFNKDAPQRLEVKIKGNGVKATTARVEGAALIKSPSLPLEVAANGRGQIEIEAIISYCNEGDGAVCLQDRVRRIVPFQVATTPSAKKEVRVAAQLAR